MAVVGCALWVFMVPRISGANPASCPLTQVVGILFEVPSRFFVRPLRGAESAVERQRVRSGNGEEWLGSVLLEREIRCISQRLVTGLQKQRGRLGSQAAS